MSRRVLIATMLADRGKFSSITFSLIRSCQERSTGWARFVVTIAYVGTVLVLVVIKILVVPSTFMVPAYHRASTRPPMNGVDDPTR